MSEYRRAIILAWTISGFFILNVMFAAIARWRGVPLPGDGWFLMIASVGCLYEWVTARFLAHTVRRGLQPARFRFYLNAIAELSFISAMILIIAAHTNPAFAVTGPASYAYFIFIILSALRLDFHLSLFTGIVAAVSFALIGSFHWKALQLAFGGDPFAFYFSFTIRVLLFAVGGLVAGLVSVRLHRTMTEAMETVQERERVITLFGQHVSPTVVDQLLKQPRGDSSDLRRVCVLVLDIRNFTTFSEKRSPAEIVALLNMLWSFMVQAVNDHHGFINKFLGDGFLAVFGAPLSEGNDCQNALGAARRILRELDLRTKAVELPPTHVGMALHAGDAIVGNIGPAERKEYTVIGDVVNVAFRLEALNKEFGTRLLISDPVRQAAGADDANFVASIQVRGRDEPVAVYQAG